MTKSDQFIDYVLLLSTDPNVYIVWFIQVNSFTRSEHSITLPGTFTLTLSGQQCGDSAMLYARGIVDRIEDYFLHPMRPCFQPLF